MGETDDRENLVASLTNPGAFALLYDRHAGVVFRFLIRRVGRDTADELLAETFKIAFERRATFDREQPSARPWLYGIANHLIARHRRREARRLHATARLMVDPNPETPTDDVVARIDASTIWPKVADAITRLPDAERDVLLLYIWEDLAYEDIARALDIPVGTVRSRLNRARRRLRELHLPSGEELSESTEARRSRSTS